MIVATVISMIVLPRPYQFQDREWLLFRFVTPIVDRGIIALLGIVLILGSCWIDSITREKQPNTANTSSLPLPLFRVSGGFAALFSILLILHLWNVFQWRTEQINSIAEQAAAAETQLTQDVDQQKELINTLLENTGLRQDAIAQGQIPNEVIALLEQLDNNPENLSTFEDRIKEGLSDRQQEIGLRREELQKEVANRALKSGLMTGVDSLLLSIGFGIIAGTGLILSK